MLFEKNQSSRLTGGDKPVHLTGGGKPLPYVGFVFNR
jgi:hypothetical protein